MPNQPEELAKAVELDALKSECRAQKVEKIGQSIQEKNPLTKSRGKFIEESAQRARKYAQVAGFHAREAQKQDMPDLCREQIVLAQKEEIQETRSLTRAMKEYVEWMKDKLSRWRDNG